MSFFGDILDPGGLGGLLNGQAGAEASLEGAEFQYQSAKEAREQLERLNQPYLGFGERGIDSFQGILNDPQYNTANTLQNDPYGANYLANNPIFQASIDKSGRELTASGAAHGKFNSGGMVDKLFQSYMGTADSMYGNYLQQNESLSGSAIDRASIPVRMGQNAANFQAAGASNLITGGGNAQAAGGVGAANAMGAGAQNLIGIGSTALGYFGGGGGSNQVLPPQTGTFANSPNWNDAWT